MGITVKQYLRSLDAIAELSDPDYPFYHASHRAYCWLKKHIENEES